MDKLKTNIIFLKLINLCNGLVFYAPIALLLRTSRGITIPQFFILQIILYSTICIMEIPCGMITDKVGYKKSIVLSIFLLLLARIQFMYARTFIIFALEAVLEGVSVCFISGTIDAYIYQLLGDTKFEQNISKIDNFGTLGFIVSTLLFYFIYNKFGQRSLILLTVISTACSLFLSFYLSELDVKQSTQNNSVYQLLNKASFWKITLFSSVFSLGTVVINFFYVTKINSLGIGEVNMTWIILAYSFVQLIVPRILARLNKEKSQSYMKKFIALIGIGFLILYYTTNIFISLIAMILIPTVHMVPYYLFSGLQNKYVDDLDMHSCRATILSVFNMGKNLISISSFILLSLNTDISGLNTFAIIGIIYLLIAIFYTNIYLKSDK